MENKLKNALIVILTIGFITLLGHEMRWWGPEDKYSQAYHNLDVECAARTEIQAAYAAVIHRIWIDNPSYVEDVLCESDEFLHLDSLLDGNWEDTFEFWSVSDSIDYENHWWNLISNDMPKKHKPEKIAQPVKPIEFINDN